MQTWQKFLPEYKVVLLDYDNLESWLGKNFYDQCLYKYFSLPKQADAVRCALLKKYGGIWLDCDTILTSDKMRDILSINSSFILIDTHIAFIKADKNSPILCKWENLIKRNIAFYKQNKSADTVLSKMRLWFLYGRCYRKLSKNLERWDYLGNMPLKNLLKKQLKTKNTKLFYSIGRQTSKALPEVVKYGICSAETYTKFYFENNFAEECLDGNGGIILLHNSWTPEKFKTMSESEFLQQNNTISLLLKRILGK